MNPSTHEKQQADRLKERQVLAQAVKLGAEITQLESELRDNQPILNQLKLLRTNLHNSREYLESTHHAVAFIGSVGVGKTTAICRILGLVDKEQRPVLSTASGRTTLCEVEIRRGARTRILIEPCSDEETRNYLRDFVDLLELRSGDGDSENGDGDPVNLSSEVERCLRNMTQLPVRRTKSPDGKILKTDEALDLYRKVGSKDAFAAQALDRLNLARRTKIELVCDTDDPLLWVRKNFEDINHGRHADTPMPQRIVVEVHDCAFHVGGLEVAVVDTKGLDGNVEREDIDRQFRNPRTVTVLCSRFNDAPEQAIQDLMQHIGDTGLTQALTAESQLLVLDRDGEAAKVMSEEGPVSSIDEGRLVRQDQIQDTLRTRLKLSEQHFPPIGFLDAGRTDDTAIVTELMNRLQHLRARRVAQIQEVAAAVEEIAKHRERALARAAFETVSAAIHSWAQAGRTRMAEIRHLYKPLVDDMTTKEVYASSIRASVNRRGSWGNFDFYYKLAVAARKKAVTSFHETVEEIELVLKNLERQDALKPVHPFIRQLQLAVNERMERLYDTAAVRGRTAFEDNMKADLPFWSAQQDEWGRGSGYKSRIAQGTEGWFQHHSPAKQEEAIQHEVFTGWIALIEEVESLLLKSAAGN